MRCNTEHRNRPRKKESGLSKVQRSTVVTLRVTQEEQEDLRRAADARHMSVSEYVREVVRAQQRPPVTSTNVLSGSATDGQQRSGEMLQVTGAAWNQSDANHMVDGLSLIHI